MQTIKRFGLGKKNEPEWLTREDLEKSPHELLSRISEDQFGYTDK